MNWLYLLLVLALMAYLMRALTRSHDYLYAARNYLPGGQQTAEPREQSNACPDAP